MTTASSGNITFETLMRLIWISTILAMIFVLPALGIFYAVYEISGNLIAGVVVGFVLHFVTLVFSPKISTKLTSWMSEAQTPGDTLAT